MTPHGNVSFGKVEDYSSQPSAESQTRLGPGGGVKFKAHVFVPGSSSWDG